MRITFKCIADGRKAGIMENTKTGKREEITIYYAEFGVIQDKETLLSGKFELNSPKPLSLYPKTGKKYTMDVNEHSGLVLLHSNEPVDSKGKDS